jgi:hypothetical protein
MPLPPPPPGLPPPGARSQSLNRYPAPVANNNAVPGSGLPRSNGPLLTRRRLPLRHYNAVLQHKHRPLDQSLLLLRTGTRPMISKLQSDQSNRHMAAICPHISRSESTQARTADLRALTVIELPVEMQVQTAMAFANVDLKVVLPESSRAPALAAATSCHLLATTLDQQTSCQPRLCRAPSVNDARICVSFLVMPAFLLSRRTHQMCRPSLFRRKEVLPLPIPPAS